MNGNVVQSGVWPRLIHSAAPSALSVADSFLGAVLNSFLFLVGFPTSPTSSSNSISHSSSVIGAMMRFLPTGAGYGGGVFGTNPSSSENSDLWNPFASKFPSFFFTTWFTAIWADVKFGAPFFPEFAAEYTAFFSPLSEFVARFPTNFRGQVRSELLGLVLCDPFGDVNLDDTGPSGTWRFLAAAAALYTAILSAVLQPRVLRGAMLRETDVSKKGEMVSENQLSRWMLK